MLNIKFAKDDDAYTATVLRKGKTLAITLDEEGDLIIGSTAMGAVAFSGSIDNFNTYEDVSTGNNANNIHLGTGNAGIHINNGETIIGTEDAGIHASNGNIRIGTAENGIQIKNGNIRLGTGNADVVIDSESTNHTGSCIIDHTHSYGVFIDCNSSEISQLPNKIVGIYRGKLSSYGIETRKGICTVVATGCKTYRLDFSNGVPSVHDVQLGRKNDFDEYTSVVIEGEYSSAIEIDMSFDDLEIDGEILRISFDGKRN